LNRKRVHISSEHDSRPVAVSQQTYYTGLPDPGGYFIPSGAQTVRGARGRPGFLHGQFRVRVQILIERFEIGDHSTEVSENRLTLLRVCHPFWPTNFTNKADCVGART
jgi:hypothetical protein